MPKWRENEKKKKKLRVKMEINKMEIKITDQIYFAHT